MSKNSTDEKSLVSIVYKYYELIDAGDREAVFALFSSDIIYQRGKTHHIQGKAEFERFYTSVRAIKGVHHIERVHLVDDEKVAVRGYFQGEFLSGEIINQLWFSDLFEFREHLICKRTTRFDDQEV